MPRGARYCDALRQIGGACSLRHGWWILWAVLAGMVIWTFIGIAIFK
ncbi:hypothetical protein Salmuc_04469 [Salipiger mucosus DSM 16094]|uniref:Uncharacterized protein n=1 Tax=Salipiger mucosus DSM 16094 TaxID=1123237 RepID=S9QE01_9RHOB|nr:hypothetical protein Salmuc_04469 [Salipiger mucosus DSM 16094]